MMAQLSQLQVRSSKEDGTGAVDFIQMTQFGDEFFDASAEVKGGGGIWI